MPYNPANLSAISYANGYTRWHYRLDDDGAPPADLFSPAWKMMRLGDQIDFVSKSHAGTVVVSTARDGIITAYLAYAVPLCEEPTP